MRTLHLNVKKEYFDQIKSGVKKEEYREVKPYWEKRLLNKEYDLVSFKNGYASNAPVISYPYKGYCIKKITHKHFGSEEITVFAIKFDYNENNSLKYN